MQSGSATARSAALGALDCTTRARQELWWRSGVSQGQRARPREQTKSAAVETKEETLTRLTQTGGSSSLDFKRLPITNFLSGAIPITNPITDLHLGRDRNSFPERASVFSVAGDSGRKGGGERAARQVHRARPSESKEETLTRLWGDVGPLDGGKETPPQDP